MHKEITIHTVAGPKHIGVVKGDVFYKEVSKKKHLFLKTDSWGIDEQVCNDVVEMGVEWVGVYDRDSRIEYRTPIKKFISEGQRYHFQPHRPQIFLAREHFETWRFGQKVENPAFKEKEKNRKKLQKKVRTFPKLHPKKFEDSPQKSLF